MSNDTTKKIRPLAPIVLKADKNKLDSLSVCYLLYPVAAVYSTWKELPCNQSRYETSCMSRVVWLTQQSITL